VDHLRGLRARSPVVLVPGSPVLVGAAPLLPGVASTVVLASLSAADDADEAGAEVQARSVEMDRRALRMARPRVLAVAGGACQAGARMRAPANANDVRVVYDGGHV
jgi:hypothetical protein